MDCGVLRCLIHRTLRIQFPHSIILGMLSRWVLLVKEDVFTENVQRKLLNI